MSKRTKELEEQLGILRCANQVLRQENEQLRRRREEPVVRVDFLGGTGLSSGYTVRRSRDVKSGDVITVETLHGRRPARVR